MQRPPTSYFLVIAYFKMNTVMPPVAADKVVFIATCAAMAPVAPSCMPRVLPGLKPYQPNHREKVPSTTNGRLWISNSSGFSKRPLRGPKIIVPIKPATPPVKWTTPLNGSGVTCGGPYICVLLNKLRISYFNTAKRGTRAAGNAAESLNVDKKQIVCPCAGS